VKKPGNRRLSSGTNRNAVEKPESAKELRDVLLKKLPLEVMKDVPDVELRLQGTVIGAKLLGVDRGNPECGETMHEAGAEDANRY